MTFLRLIGRLAFPLYCFLIVNGMEHTRSKIKYLARLLFFAFLSQIPYMTLYRVSVHLPPLSTPEGESLFSSPQLFFPAVTQKLNSIFVLFLGLLSIAVIQALQRRMPGKHGDIWGNLAGLCFAGGLCVVSFVIHCEYAALGVPLIAAFYEAAWLNRKYPEKAGALRGLLPLCAIAGYTVYNVVRMTQFSSKTTQAMYGTAQAFCLIFVFCYNKEKRGFHNKIIKYSFYWFYPGHIAALMGIYLAVT